MNYIFDYRRNMVLIFVLMLFVSCVQVDNAVFENTDYAQFSIDDDWDQNYLAEVLMGMEIDKLLCAEVFDSVQKSVESGMDENLYFRELWMSDDVVKVKSYSDESILKSRLEKSLREMWSTKSSSQELSLANSDMQLYWPYSDRWDGITMPVIAPAPEEESDEFYGYRKVLDDDGSYIIETVLVNDDFAYDNPVWIINHMEFPYEEIQERLSFWNSRNETRSSTTGYLWEIDKMRVTKQYDKLTNGGSEFEVIVTFPQMPGYAPGQNRHMYEFTRSQIRNNAWVSIGLSSRLLNTDWSPEQLSNHFALYGWDGGDMNQTVTSGTVAWQDPTTGLTTSSTVSYTIYTKSTPYLTVNYARGYFFSLGDDTMHGISDGTVSWYTKISEY